MRRCGYCRLGSRTGQAGRYRLWIGWCGLNARNEVIESLDRGLEIRDPMMVFLAVDPKWKELRHDPRFVALVERMFLSRLKAK